jgi:hypothetical protein
VLGYLDISHSPMRDWIEEVTVEQLLAELPAAALQR